MSLSHPQRAQLPVTLLPISPLKVPRRSTLCAPVRTPEQLPARFDASLSTHAASAPPATRRYTEIAPRKTPSPGASSSARPKIRPLPNPPLSPGPKSAPPHTHTPRRQTSTSSFRPLPRVPEAAAVSVSVSVTPASPVDPPLPVVRSQTHLFPPPTTVVAPPRFASLSLRLDTSPDALEPRASPPHAAASRPEPPVDALPSPATARRRRMSKLRRHLGESVQILFTDAEEKREFGDVCSQTAVAVRKLLELDAADDDGSDTDTDDGGEDRYSLVLAHGDAHCAIPLKRYSTKWIREQGSRQFVEENWSNILRDLRAL